LQEWWEIENKIKYFFLALGLLINVSKSTFHQARLLEQELSPFKYLFPFNFFDMATRFKYLGFYLKTGPQCATDWIWLIQRMEKNIDNSCYRWLSLGGRITLLKVALESQPVYWLSLAVIPCSVLNALRKLMINFLWKGNHDTKHYHLCKWDMISLPKCDRGWGLQNIMDFNHALAVNSLWRVLTSTCIWHHTINDKYLPQSTIKNWLRSPTLQQKYSSSIWGGLLKSVHLINHWLSWNPGTGQLIDIGEDRILGMGEQSYLSTNLISALH
jgi:hypothetical protein